MIKIMSNLYIVVLSSNQTLHNLYNLLEIVKYVGIKLSQNYHSNGLSLIV